MSFFCLKLNLKKGVVAILFLLSYHGLKHVLRSFNLHFSEFAYNLKDVDDVLLFCIVNLFAYCLCIVCSMSDHDTIVYESPNPVKTITPT
jgi:hypothetical protein